MRKTDFSRVIDFHVHIGRFRDAYFDPVETARLLLEDVGVRGIAVSSTSAGDPVYDGNLLLSEAAPLFERWPGRIFHFFWVHPGCVPDKSFLEDSPVPIHGLKVHQGASDWTSCPGALESVFRLAEERGLLLLIHTGGDANCDAGAYMDIVSRHPWVRVILAHGRPIDQAVKVLDSCLNAWVDTAFMGPKEIKTLVDAGFSRRIVFGSDFPITTLHADTRLAPKDQYAAILRGIRKKFGAEIFDLWTSGVPSFLWNAYTDGYPDTVTEPQDYAGVMLSERINSVIDAKSPGYVPPAPGNFMERAADGIATRIAEKHLARVMELPPDNAERRARLFAAGKIVDAFPAKYSRNFSYNEFIAYGLVYNWWYLSERLRGVLGLPYRAENE